MPSPCQRTRLITTWSPRWTPNLRWQRGFRQYMKVGIQGGVVVGSLLVATGLMVPPNLWCHRTCGDNYTKYKTSTSLQFLIDVKQLSNCIVLISRQIFAKRYNLLFQHPLNFSYYRNFLFIYSQVVNGCVVIKRSALSGITSGN